MFRWVATKPHTREWTGWGAGDGPGTTFLSKAGTIWTYHYPKAEDLTTAQKKHLHDYLDQFETMMKGPDFGSRERGYAAKLDAGSFVDYLLVSELTKNTDGYRRSSYFHKDVDAAGGRLVAGPLWDFDLGYGNNMYGTFHRPDGWALDAVSAYKPPENTPAFWLRLWRDPAFRAALGCRWLALRKTSMSLPAIDAKIDAWLALVGQAERRDHARWPVLGTVVWPNHYVGATYADEVTWLRRWIADRLRWMDENLPRSCPAPP